MGGLSLQNRIQINKQGYKPGKGRGSKRADCYLLNKFTKCIIFTKYQLNILIFILIFKGYREGLVKENIE